MRRSTIPKGSSAFARAGIYDLTADKLQQSYVLHPLAVARRE